ncbi:BnaA01g19690D [Brassica napus]|uniref:BnaA01g19690D protein n=1 Tax=Brassica napus TaxID=3708 RepID=A0A078H7A4_BRANA|nr:BnaA01g19690D [Brassica napus]
MGHRVLGFRSVATEIVAFPIIGSLCGGEACLDGKASGLEKKWVIFGALCSPLPVVVRRLGFPSTDIAKLSGVDTNQLEQRCGKAKITKMLSRASSKVPAPFGNATLGQAPASGSASFLYC